jgi:beta-ureidopropionase / N-carbamoyl-L-amino-acid hydrolase
VIEAWPNNRINIPHRATFSYGLMHPDAVGMLEMAAKIDAAEARITAETGLRFNTLVRRRRDPVYFDETIVSLVEACAAKSGHSCQRMRTRPGHDAFNMTRLCPTELIFVPCRDGISHSELEWCAPEHCAAGADVLLQAALQRANR